MSPSLSKLGLIHLIDADSRPIFVVALTSLNDSQATRQIEYLNPALIDTSPLVDLISSVCQDVHHTGFWDWIVGAQPSRDLSTTTTSRSWFYFGIYWTRIELLGKWVVVSGNDTPIPGQLTANSGLEVTREVKRSRAEYSELVRCPQNDSASGKKRCSEFEITRRYEDKLETEIETQSEQVMPPDQELEAVTEFTPMGVLLPDNRGNIIFVNDAWYHILDHPPDCSEPVALPEYTRPQVKYQILYAYDYSTRPGVVTHELRMLRSEHQTELQPTTLREQECQVERRVLAVTRAKCDDTTIVLKMLTFLMDVNQGESVVQKTSRYELQEENLRRLAESAAVGTFALDLEGRLLCADKTFWDLTGLTKLDLKTSYLEPWQECVAEQDLSAIQRTLVWAKTSGKPETAHVQLKSECKIISPDGTTGNTQRSVQVIFVAVKSPKGTTQSVIGCLRDISLSKWQLEQERLRKEQAIAQKKQHENFVDMTSHEMRNPLNSILHCTDEIITSLYRVEACLEEARLRTAQSRSHDDPIVPPTLQPEWYHETRKALEASIEDAETILGCAQHQKRIVDDILTMSKMDAMLLAVTPCTTDPVQIIKETLQMFQVEARRADVALATVIDPTYTALGSDYLDFDPSRVKQILINLVTNALKFTKPQNTRSITVSLKGCYDPPDHTICSVNFIPRLAAHSTKSAVCQSALDRTNKPVYLLFEVKDTGPGLSEEEIKLLFNKFVQASAQTHVKYGGSGLGLFISRRLAELQNGAIGVSSQPGLGTVFSFYIEAYISETGYKTDARDISPASIPPSRIEQPSASLGSGVGVMEDSQRLGLDNSSHGRDYRVLLVDDNIVNQRIAKRELTRNGYSVIVANHGEEVLALLSRPAPGAVASSESTGGGPALLTPLVCVDLILMDMEMPIQDGLTCTKRIRELEQQGQVFSTSGGPVPIIAVTANAKDDQIAAAMAAKCDDVLLKPYRIGELLSKMEAVMTVSPRRERKTTSSPAV